MVKIRQAHGMPPIRHGHIRKRDDKRPATTASTVAVQTDRGNPECNTTALPGQIRQCAAIKTVDPLRPDMTVGADSTAITQTRFNLHRIVARDDLINNERGRKIKAPET
ncbi:hypothetical protein AA0616_2224 [Komagataeibacter nataicola NRIC 0616]|nr:hypothetical protein AA0616_2224 [Komagataeibacter nataicola NRIC 0616]